MSGPTRKGGGRGEGAIGELHGQVWAARGDGPSLTRRRATAARQNSNLRGAGVHGAAAAVGQE